ncbi:DNA adenine methylase [Candidatus Micrarchaeota archaeon]|nr:DNA adenine methylase [Candidatus Micrarchaeota archaeon]
MCDNAPKPFVKWAGGKRQLINTLLDNIPSSFSNYHEPFVGGGALYFRLWNEGLIKKAYLNDFNEHLYNTYRVIKKNPDELIEELTSSQYKNEKTIYYKLRDKYNQKRYRDNTERAALFMYFNKTGFNGLWRVNSKDGYNVPIGKYKNPKICDEDNIRLVSEALKKAELTNRDFSTVLDNAKTKDFVYFDPPYHPLSSTSNFTTYTKLDFTEKDQIRLKEVYVALDLKKVNVMLSNSPAPLITQLYSNYKQKLVDAKRMINCKSELRGNVSEIVAINY